MMRLPADRRIFLNSYAYDDKTGDQSSSRPGPTVLVDALDGEVLAVVLVE